MKHIVTHVSHPTFDSVMLRFKKENDLLHYHPGQHGQFYFTINGVKHQRNYSFVTSPLLDSDLAITIRLITSGVVSHHLLQEAIPGMEINLKSIQGSFKLSDLTVPKHLIMFAGGSGITPIISMLRTALHACNQTCVSLIYSNTTFDKIIFRDELEELSQQFGHRFTLFHIISQLHTVPEGFPVFLGERLGKLITKKLLRTRLSYDVTLLPEVYICGPHDYIQMVEESTKGIDASVPIHKEHFYTPLREEETNAFDHLPTREILIHWKNAKYPIQVQRGESILMAALNQGINLPHSCKEAQCGLCRSTLLRGKVKMSRNFVLTENEIRQQQVLLCHGYPMSDDVVIVQGTKQTIL